MPKLLYNRCCRSCKFSCTKIRCALFLFAFRNAPSGLVNTMPAAVSVYDRLKSRNTGFSTDNFIFLPAYKNRSTAKQIIQRQFNALLERCRLKEDVVKFSAHRLLPPSYRDLYAYHLIGRQSKHLQPCQECRDVCRSDRALLCAQSAAVAGMAINLQSFGSG